MAYVGIDYGNGITNRDPENGIRYGVISQHSVSQVWCDEAEPEYGPATCPECGGEVSPYDPAKHVVPSENPEEDDSDYEQYKRGCADYACESCKMTFDSCDCFPDEATGWTLSDGKYTAEDCLDSDIIILASPYYTFAPFCSPCVPGAGNLDSAESDASESSGVKTYCFSHDWFEEGKAPYPVFRVSDDSEVLPE